ncbi:MAG TPA: hypothetical protein VH458_22470 [Vicinamibacterales bacterium]
MADLEVPLSVPSHSAKHISAEQYYRLPVRSIYKSYSSYDADREPPGYRAWLLEQEPTILWDDGAHRPRLETEADWIKAGELVFNAPVLFFPGLTSTPEERRTFVARTGDVYDRDGVSPFSDYVVRERGKVEVGDASCRECHTRVMADGTVIRGAQGNRPVERIAYLDLAVDAGKAADPDRFLADAREGQRRSFAAPWFTPDPNARLERFSAAEIEAVHFAIPPGVFARQGTSPLSPAKLPDLIGVKERRYLDASGLVQHRNIGDLMRYAALNQGMDMLARFGDFVPAGDAREVGGGFFERAAGARYSDEQLYALALYIYSLKPPPNPNKRDGLASRGQGVFEAERCGTCHTPPIYTNNALTPALGFTVPKNHSEKFQILRRSVGTDSTLTLTTRRGTGYYKVPSLKGVWYRGPFEHNGSVSTLEDWFDPRRLRDDYVPTGWRGYGVTTRAVPGHEFGLKLSAEDKRALIAFLKTL